MNYYGPRETDGRWDYTCRNDGHIWPVGYCRAYKEFDTSIIPVSEAEQEEYRATAHKHHSDGHATEEEACECYKQYLLDHKLRFGTMSDQQLRCKVCEEWTQNYAEVDCQTWNLCDKHNSRETVEALMEAPGVIWSSW